MINRTRAGWSRLAPLAQVGAAITLSMIAFSILIPLASPYGVTELVADALEPPSASHWFGTDGLGRDLFTRTFAAGRITIALAVVGVIVP